MTLGHLALLAGLFAVPVFLLLLGHRLRRRPPLWRRIFWGAVAGHIAGLLVLTIATHYPPVVWEGGSVWRDLAVYWSPLVGAALGALVAAVVGAGAGAHPNR